jgi:hypothetical protein
MPRLRQFCCAALAVGSLGFAACSEADPAPTPVPEPEKRVLAPPAPRLQRLLARQYVASVGLLLGDAAGKAADPPADSELQGFQAIAATQLSLNDSLVAKYEASARAVAAAAMADHHHVASLMATCDPEASASDCYQVFTQAFGRLAFRRPITDDEADDYLTVAQHAAEGFGDFYAGIETTMASMLQSPHFLYRVEIGEPTADGKRRKLTAYEIASRMSFFLLDTTPSAELLAAAQSGKLDSEAGVRTMAEALLTKPAAKRAMRAFFAEYLAIDDLGEVTKDPVLYPNYSPGLAASMKRETLELVEDVVWAKNDSVATLLTARHSFLDAALAEHYGVDLEGKKAWSRIKLPADQKRSGLLTQGSIMTRRAHPTSTSVTQRGLFIMERFLCESMPAPPPEVVTTLPPTSTAPTMRERLAIHLAHPTCAGCHNTSDNLGLALENFDSVGVFRSKENGVSIDTSVELEDVGTFDGPVELGELLASMPRVKACMLRNLFRHAMGRIETNGDLAGIEELDALFEESGYRFKQLLVDLVASEVFVTVGSFEP